MGIDQDIAKLCLWARKNGVDFSQPLTIGRMGLHLSSAEMESALSQFGVQRSAAEMAELFTAQEGFAEPFFRLLGAVSTASLDASGFEGATFVHDLNQQVPANRHAQYSVVLDGGTLEHIFDYPTALRNCMEMVAVGGHFMTVTPANNYCGHGFYQLSPELFFRVLQEENGFQLEKMVLFEIGRNRWYEVIDPEKAGRRVSLVNDRPTMLGVWARRTRQTKIFPKPPQQSDYANKWSKWSPQKNSTPQRCRESERQQRLWAMRWLHSVKKWFKPTFPSKFYRLVEW
jgi:hypothetical protein